MHSVWPWFPAWRTITYRKTSSCTQIWGLISSFG